jgi:hypothetical protein
LTDQVLIWQQASINALPCLPCCTWQQLLLL